MLIKLLLFQQHKPLSIKVYHSNMQSNQENYCASRVTKCSNFCVGGSNNKSRCICPRNAQLKEETLCIFETEANLTVTSPKSSKVESVSYLISSISIGVCLIIIVLGQVS